MKKLSILVAAFLSFVMSAAQEVDFIKVTWQEANDLAAKENKYIFVDAYTEWCGWCKVMDKEMFTDLEVASLLNESFIPLKIDFEDSLGIILSMKFRVWSYPTTLVFNPQGQLVDKFSGFTYDHSEYVDFLKECLEIKVERVFSFDSRELDLQYPEIYSQAFLMENRKWPSDSAVNAYLEGQQDLFSEVNWSVISRFSPREYEDDVLTNIDKYTRFYGEKEVTDYLYTIIYDNLFKAIKGNDKALLDRSLDLCDKLQDPEPAKISVMMTYYKETKDWKGFAQTVGSFIELNGYTDHMTINDNCWTIYENVEDTDIIQKAIGWMKPVIEAEPTWMYLDTYAALLYKYGNLEEALNYADQAIAAGEKAGEKDISSTKELREKIIKAMEKQ